MLSSLLDIKQAECLLNSALGGSGSKALTFYGRDLGSTLA